MLAMSRCVVGSSMSSRFGGLSSSLTNPSRLFSPPLSTATDLNTSSPRKRKLPSTLRVDCSLTGMRDVLRFLQDRVARVERVAAVLRVVADLHVAAHDALAALDGQHAREDFEQRRFARAVGPDEHDALAALGGEVQPLVNRLAARVSLVDVFERDRFQPAARGLREAEFHRRGLVLRGLDFLHARDLLELALRLAGEAGLGAETVGEALQALDLALLRLVGGELLLAAGGALDEVAVVVAPVECRWPWPISAVLWVSWLRNSRSCEIIRIAPG